MNIFDFFFNKKNNKISANTEKTNKSVLKSSHSSKEIEAVARRTYSEEELELNIENFIKELNIKMSEAKINLDYLEYNIMSDKTYNFTYMRCQIGRIKITKKTSRMQILTNTKVKWIENRHMLDYYKNIDKWIKYTKQIIRSQKEYYL